VDSRYLEIDENGIRTAGGVFSLDGIHPSAVGQGLMAEEFGQVMRDARVELTGGLDWPGVYAGDTLLTRPLPILGEIYRHDKLAEAVGHLLKFLKAV
jgi:hypothetical protein